MSTDKSDKVSQIQNPPKRSHGKPAKASKKPIVDEVLAKTDKVSQIQQTPRVTKHRAINKISIAPSLFTKSGMPLTHTQCDFILKRIAYFYSASDILQEFMAFFNEAVLLQTIRIMDPYHIDPDDWAIANRDRFDVYRQQAIASVHAIPIANQYARMQEAQKIYERAIADEDFTLARRMLEYAAREEGGMYTNVRKLDGTIKIEALTDEELHAKLVSFLGEDNLPEAIRPLIDYQGAKETEYEEVKD